MSTLAAPRFNASPMDDRLLDRAIEAFPNATFSQAYGMTELSPTCTILGPDDHSAEAGFAPLRSTSGAGRNSGWAYSTRVARAADLL